MPDKPVLPADRHLPLLTLGALGVVYGDIGTSPLYALRECFHPTHGVPVSEANVLGVLSLIVWALVLVVTVKYILFVMRADNDGEGGILALMALAQHHRPTATVAALGGVGVLGLIGASFLYGDGIITPAISVLSAVEGLEISIPALQPYVVPITVLILAGLFLVQYRGTGRIGSIFGPVMLLWFGTMGVLGLLSVVRSPQVLQAGNPLHAVRFLIHHASQGFVVLSSIFLALTGAEALYADMGHFGRRPIQAGWFAIALPALLFQYFGQGALLLRDPATVSNPFYHLAASWMQYPLVALATVATIIASQAMLTGVFSLTLQAVQLGYFPPVDIRHTSERQIGQIYVPALNWFMAVGTISLVVAFGSSSRLASAYGIAVSGTMVITTLLMYAVARHVWKWRVFLAGAVVAGLAVVDLSFFGANAVKIPHGGWFPLVLGAFMFTLMTTWHRGRAIVMQHINTQFPPFDRFVEQALATCPVRVPGWAVFMTTRSDATPPAFLQNVKHNKALHQHLIFLTILTERVPHVPCEKQLEVRPIKDSVYRILVRYGFMDRPNVPQALRDCSVEGLHVPLEDTTFFLSRLTFLATPKPGMALWREHLFVFLTRNSQRSSSYFQIHPDQVVEIGLVVEI
ncbi:potassium transporter Kup [Candidatus Nitrospira bockiana]